MLLGSGVLDEDQLGSLLAEQAAQPRASRQRLGALVIDRGLATERQIAAALAQALGLLMVDLTSSSVSATAARLIPRAVAERYGVIGVSHVDGVLTVAMTDPTNVVALDDVRLYTGARSIAVVVATEGAVRDYLSRAWSLGEDSSDVTGMFDDLATAGLVEDDPELALAGEETPTVRLVNAILTDAVRARGSDIHLEPELDGVRVRYRVDGLLRDVMTVPRSAASAMTSRVKIMSGLDIAERRRPQDGRTRINVEGESVDARVSTLPTMHGEKVVIRLLSRAEGVLPLARVGLSEGQLNTVLGTLVAPQGLVLITGPTGSGKTSTLYSAVCQVRTPDRNIVTLEDPIEMQLRGVNQVQVNERAGLTFATGLRSILRQDPDVVLVGEVRDSDTAELAMRASLTGHLVFTTLHTNDAASAVTRLVDMGVEPFLIASSLAMVIAQRLVRVPCPGCAAPYTPSPRTLVLLGLADEDLVGGSALRGRGCDDCGHTGYHGRVAIFEVLPVDAAMREVLTSRATESAIRVAARGSGVMSMRADGIAKAMRGETTFEEVLRVTHVDATSAEQCARCDRDLEDGMAFCPWCATSVADSGCTSCHRKVDPEWRVCPWCRTPNIAAGLPLDLPAVHSGRRAQVLVVDDDDSVLAFAHAALVDVAEVITARTAEEGMRVVATRTVDAVVIDIALPDLSGLEMTRLLRSDTHTALIPVVLLTGTDNAALRLEASHAGAEAYLTKPVEPGELAMTLTALIESASVVPPTT